MTQRGDSTPSAVRRGSCPLTQLGTTTVLLDPKSSTERVANEVAKTGERVIGARGPTPALMLLTEVRAFLPRDRTVLTVGTRRPGRGSAAGPKTRGTASENGPETPELD
eukprot:10281553-Lingulodinium_polyedra.AAC.1